MAFEIPQGRAWSEVEAILRDRWLCPLLVHIAPGPPRVDKWHVVVAPPTREIPES